MATKITNAALIAAGKQLLAHIRAGKIIPYVRTGMTLDGMDCQGLVEYCLIQAGVPKSECNLSGSNAHWRAAAWRGTPEELTRILGAVPGGACPVIWQKGGEPPQYERDGLDNADHIGLYLGDGLCLAASASRGCVIESNFRGKTVPNGGWNRVLLLPWVEYGLSDAQLSALGMAGNTSQPVSAAPQMPTSKPTLPDVSSYYTIKRGCLGGAVRRLQTWLNDIGMPLTVDGEFGPATETAVLHFQAQHGLTVDGIVGQRTWAALAQARQSAMEGAGS